MSIRRRHRPLSKWAMIPEPPSGARYRGYLRYSERDLKGVANKTTFMTQRAEIEAYGSARGWVCDGWDEEPAVSGAAEDIALRPAFQRHLADAAAGRFEVSLCCMSDRWARDTEIAVGSLKRLRRAGIYWATADGQWDINKVISDGHSVAWVVDAEINASYARKISQKSILARRERARAGYHNGRVTWGYQRSPGPPPPPDAPYNWRPPRAPAQPHPDNFSRLQQIGEWAAAGLSDREIADRATSLGWPLKHRIKGSVPWGKPFICGLLTNHFPREFAPGSGQGTILTPAGVRIEGNHLAAWSWDLWHRIDEARMLNRRGTRGKTPTEGHIRLFSGLAVCAGCGRALHHQLRRGSISGTYGVYLCAASDTGYACPVRTSERVGTGKRGARGFRAIRSSALEEQFATRVLDWELPPDWRERIAAEVNRMQDSGKLAEAAGVRTNLLEERKRILFQHRSGRISDEDMLGETAHIDGILATLPDADQWEMDRRLQYSAADTFASQYEYWDGCTPFQRAEVLRLILEPFGMAVDLTRQVITRIKPRPVLLPTFRAVLAETWHETDGGWLMCV